MSVGKIALKPLFAAEKGRKTAKIGLKKGTRRDFGKNFAVYFLWNDNRRNFFDLFTEFTSSEFTAVGR